MAFTALSDVTWDPSTGKTALKMDENWRILIHDLFFTLILYFFLVDFMMKCKLNMIKHVF